MLQHRANLAPLLFVQPLRLLSAVAGDKGKGIGIADIQKLDCSGYLLWAHLKAGRDSLSLAHELITT